MWNLPEPSMVPTMIPALIAYRRCPRGFELQSGWVLGLGRDLSGAILGACGFLHNDVAIGKRWWGAGGVRARSRRVGVGVFIKKVSTVHGNTSRECHRHSSSFLCAGTARAPPGVSCSIRGFFSEPVAFWVLSEPGAEPQPRGGSEILPNGFRHFELAPGEWLVGDLPGGARACVLHHAPMPWMPSRQQGPGGHQGIVGSRRLPVCRGDPALSLVYVCLRVVSPEHGLRVGVLGRAWVPEF